MSIAAARPSRREARLDEMKITFDADELASFFDHFASLEVDEAGFPVPLDEPPAPRS